MGGKTSYWLYPAAIVRPKNKNQCMVSKSFWNWALDSVSKIRQFPSRRCLSNDRSFFNVTSSQMRVPHLFRECGLRFKLSKCRLIVSKAISLYPNLQGVELNNFRIVDELGSGKMLVLLRCRYAELLFIFKSKH